MFVFGVGSEAETIIHWNTQDRHSTPADFSAWLAERAGLADGNTVINLVGSGSGTDTITLQGLTGTSTSDEFFFAT